MKFTVETSKNSGCTFLCTLEHRGRRVDAELIDAAGHFHSRLLMIDGAEPNGRTHAALDAFIRRSRCLGEAIGAMYAGLSAIRAFDENHAAWQLETGWAGNLRPGNA